MIERETKPSGSGRCWLEIGNMRRYTDEFGDEIEKWEYADPRYPDRDKRLKCKRSYSGNRGGASEKIFWQIKIPEGYPLAIAEISPGGRIELLFEPPQATAEMETAEVSTENRTNHVDDGMARVGPFDINPNPFQPRMQLDFVNIQELAEDIEQNGLLQPPTIRSTPDGEYQLAFGHRRLAAWKQLYKKHGGEKGDYATMPCFIKDLSDEAMYRAAAAENGQRQDLNIVEVARSIEAAKQLGISQQEAGKLHGYASKGTVSSIVQLLKLPGGVLEALADGRLAFGHGRELLRLVKGGVGEEFILKLAERAIKNELTVYQLKIHVDRELKYFEFRQRQVTRHCPHCGNKAEISEYHDRFASWEMILCGACKKKEPAVHWLSPKDQAAKKAAEQEAAAPAADAEPVAEAEPGPTVADIEAERRRRLVEELRAIGEILPLDELEQLIEDIKSRA